MIDVATATSAELLAYFNEHSGKPAIKKFADRKTAERRVAALLSGDAVTEPVTQSSDESTNLGSPETAPEAEPTKEADMASKTKKASTKKPRAKKAPKPPADRSKAVSESWKNAKTAKARSTHSNVKVGGETYRSVRAAFAALKLPDSKHIKFRMLLRASENGKATFTDEKGNKHNFSIVAAE